MYLQVLRDNGAIDNRIPLPSSPANRNLAPRDGLCFARLSRQALVVKDGAR